MPKKESLLVNRIKSINYAFRGAILLIKTEASIQIQFVIAILVTIAGFYFNLNTTEWIVQILAICIIMSVEGLNTAIEKIADFIHPEHHSKIGFIKDISAGAVFISAISGIVIGLIIYLPKIF
ncbi:MAG: diacylglycerol kinase family protein [Flavobacteriaceae bacterium]